MRGKRGWIRILEATIAVMIVSGVMISVYSNQSVREDVTIADYSYSLQHEILDDIVTNSSLRLNVLAVVNDIPGDADYDILNSFINDSIPDSFGYLLRVCDLGDSNDFCKMGSGAFIATLDKDVFVEEVVVSAEIGDGTNTVYSPKKVRLFFWEGGMPENFCIDECGVGEVILSCSVDNVMNSTCVAGSDGCYDIGASVIVEDCSASGEVCSDGACVAGAPTSGYIEKVCEMQVVTDMGCVDDSLDATICAGYDMKQETGGCDCDLFGCDGDYTNCINILSETTACELNPICSGGYTEVSSSSCSLP